MSTTSTEQFLTELALLHIAERAPGAKTSDALRGARTAGAGSSGPTALAALARLKADGKVHERPGPDDEMRLYPGPRDLPDLNLEGLA